jgi:hypothetical protein
MIIANMPAHVPVKWAPVRRQEHAPRNIPRAAGLDEWFSCMVARPCVVTAGKWTSSWLRLIEVSQVRWRLVLEARH